MPTYEGLRLKILKYWRLGLANYRKKQLKSTNFTIISNNCWGGMIYESYNLPKESPTVGMFFIAKDYIEFLSDLKGYVNGKLTFISPTKSRWKDIPQISEDKRFGSYPVGVLSNGKNSIEIFFLHYHSEQEVREKWERRVKRINWNKLLVKFNDQNGCTETEVKGNVITGDHILYIYGCYMKERGKLLNNTVVTTVMSNFGLYKAFDERGIGYAKTAVGDKYVYEYMVKNDCRIGGEQSGHIIFSKYASTGDGILTSLKMMEVMLAKKKLMSELTAPLKIYPQVLENIRVTDKKAAQNDPAVQEAVSRVAEALGDTGRILVRESGTEPVVRVMVEAPDHDTCQKYVDEVVNVICEKGYKA